MDKEKERKEKNSIITIDLEGPGCVMNLYYTEEEMEKIRKANKDLCEEITNADLKRIILKYKSVSEQG